MDQIWAKFSEYGLVGLIIAVLFLILWKFLDWFMMFIKEEREKQTEERKQHSEERQVWLAQVKAQGDAWFLQMKAQGEILQKICSGLEEHDKRADERGRYVREEHKEMIASLGRINGYKHD